MDLFTVNDASKSRTRERALFKYGSFEEIRVFPSISARAINHSFRLTGLEKFKNCDGEAPEDLNPDTILNELNERLEEALVLSED